MVRDLKKLGEFMENKTPNSYFFVEIGLTVSHFSVFFFFFEKKKFKNEQEASEQGRASPTGTQLHEKKEERSIKFPWT